MSVQKVADDLVLIPLTMPLRTGFSRGRRQKKVDRKVGWTYHVNMIDVVHSRNCVCQTVYHMVWCPKYRKAILTGDVASRVSVLLAHICEQREWPVLALEIQPDHIHLFLSLPPATSIASAIKILKGTTARKLFQEFPKLKQELSGGHLWSPSYYVGTAGQRSAEVIERYIARTEHIRGRR